MTAPLRDAPPGRRFTVPAPLVVGVVVGWITLVLLVDAHDAIAVQRLLGAGTWCVLVALLWGELPLVRVQTAIVVVFASIVEYTCSPLLGVYLYRFHNVPAYVPPGHGLVYLAALTIGRTAFVQRHRTGLAGSGAAGGRLLGGVRRDAGRAT